MGYGVAVFPTQGPCIALPQQYLKGSEIQTCMPMQPRMGGLIGELPASGRTYQVPQQYGEQHQSQAIGYGEPQQLVARLRMGGDDSQLRSSGQLAFYRGNQAPSYGNGLSGQASEVAVFPLRAPQLATILCNFVSESISVLSRDQVTPAWSLGCLRHRPAKPHSPQASKGALRPCPSNTEVPALARLGNRWLAA